MWPWVLAGALVLLNLATILVVAVLLRLHVRRVETRREAPAEDSAFAQAELTTLREDVADLVRQLDRLAEDIDARVEDRADKLRGLLTRADERIADLQRLSSQSPRPAREPPAAGSPRAEVLHLAGQGLDAVEIARRTNLDVGEVELVLSLERSVRVDGR
jgi:hypothetical protein